MNSHVTVLFWINLSLLFTHELDAIRRREWRLFVFLNRLSDETAHRVFTVLHLPLFLLILWLINHRDDNVAYWFQIAADLFLIVHVVLHFLFQKKEKNEFSSFFSKFIIQAMGLIGWIHLLLIFDTQRF